MTRFEKAFGGVAVVAAIVGSIMALLSLEVVAVAIGLVVLVPVIFLVAQVLREARRQKRNLELLAESVRMTRAVANDAKREANAARSEVTDHSSGTRGFLEDQFQMIDSRDTNLAEEVHALSRSIRASVEREGRGIRSVVRDGAQQSHQAMQEAESALTAHIDARSRQIRTQVVTERRNTISEVQASEGRIGSTVSAGSDAVREAQHVIAQKLIARQDGLQEVIDEIETVVARSADDLNELSEKLSALAGANALEAVGQDLADLRRRVQMLGQSIEQLCQHGEETGSATMTLLADLAAAQSKLDALQVENTRTSDQAEADRAAIDTVGREVQAVGKEFQEGVKNLADRQAAESNRLTVAMRNETQQIEALLHLMDGIEPRWIMPSLGRWALDARAALHLRTIVEDRNPATVLEVGGGSSTILLGYLCEKIGAQVISVDHHPTFVERTQAMVRRHGLEATVDVRLGELEPYEIGGREYLWYARSAFEGIADVDLLFVDGPPSTTGSMARFPAVPELHDRLSDGAAVVLDDSERPDEKSSIQRWLSRYPDFRRSQEGVSRLAYLEKC